MSYLHTELVAPFELHERYRRADRARLVSAVAHERRPERTAPVRLGRFLVRVGERLEASARPRRGAQPHAVWIDPCHGCAN